MAPEDEGKYKPIVDYNNAVKEGCHSIPYFTPMLQLMVALLLNRSVNAEVRDAVIDA